MSQTQSAIDATVSAAASKATTTGSVVTVAGWATSSDVGMALGILVAIVGLAVNWYYKKKNDRRAQEIHEATLKQLDLSTKLVAAELEDELKDDPAGAK